MFVLDGARLRKSPTAVPTHDSVYTEAKERCSMEVGEGLNPLLNAAIVQPRQIHL